MTEHGNTGEPAMRTRLKPACHITAAACLFALLPASLSAAATAVVRWQLTGAPHKPVRPGQPFDVTITGAIEPGWHVYALDEPDGGPVATVVALAEGDPADLLRVTAAKPVEVNDPEFNMRTGLYTGHAEFTLHVRAPRSVTPGPATLHALVRYQSCDSHVCLPPHTDTVAVPVTFAQ